MHGMWSLDRCSCVSRILGACGAVRQASRGSADRASMVARTSLRVLLTGPDFKEFRGGIQTFVESAIAAFRCNDSVDIDFFPLTLGLYDEESWFAKVARNVRGLRPFVQRLRLCNVVHFNSSFDNRSVARDLAYIVLALTLHKQVVLQFHGGQPASVMLFRMPILRRVVANLLRRCHAILVLSKFQANEFHRVLPSIRSVRQVANYIEPGPRVSRNRASDSPIRFLYLGRLHSDKGIHEILSATRELLNEGRDFEVSLCGDGPEKTWIERQLADCDLQQHVRMLGVVRGIDKAKALESADVLLLPTRHREGFPYVLLEAFSAGLPIIATPVGAIPEVVHEGRTGRLVPIGDHAALVGAMRSFICDRAQLADMAASARALVEAEFSLNAMCRVFGEIYGACPVKASSAD